MDILHWIVLSPHHLRLNDLQKVVEEFALVTLITKSLFELRILLDDCLYYLLKLLWFCL